MLLANGGTWAIESPFPYSKVARGLMDELGINPEQLAKKCYREDVYKNLGNAVFFDKQTFGADQLVTKAPSSRMGRGGSDDWKTFLEKAPVAPEIRRDILRLQTEAVDYLPGLTSDQKKDKLSRMSYKSFLLNVAKVHPGCHSVLPDEHSWAFWSGDRCGAGAGLLGAATAGIPRVAAGAGTVSAAWAIRRWALRRRRSHTNFISRTATRRLRECWCEE